jgi:hypothetical protein
MKPSFYLGLLVLSGLLFGCQQREIRVYTAPKDVRALVQVSEPQATTPQWTAPESWVSQPSTAFRVGSFTISGAAGPADLAISFLSGQAGGVLANINRWRDQIQLAPTDEEGLSQITKTLTLKGDTVLFVDLTSADMKTRMLVAIWEKPEGAWFFKLTGPAATILETEQDFSRFLESVVWP